MKTRKKRAKIWTLTKEELIQVVNNSATLSEILKHFELGLSSGSYTSLKYRLKIEEIDYSHIKLGINSNKGKILPWIRARAKPLSEILIEHSTYDRGELKRKLLHLELLENKCYECNLPPLWNNKKLTLQIDHINGISDDNRIENLQMLCPNCHAQTNTYAGKNWIRK